ncbi:hypothetical protein H9L39_03348 [Fusarium oxysporum f. sp. albedinis]|nr:hypothetical protein H9L39_03348 [Fusarium oxysporum f. sp. albedinis]
MNVRSKGPRSLENPGLSRIGHLSREWGRKLEEEHTVRVHFWGAFSAPAAKIVVSTYACFREQDKLILAERGTAPSSVRTYSTLLQV